jgi:hypothetical protein
MSRTGTMARAERMAGLGCDSRVRRAFGGGKPEIGRLRGARRGAMGCATWARVAAVGRATPAPRLVVAALAEIGSCCGPPSGNALSVPWGISVTLWRCSANPRRRPVTSVGGRCSE